jgi:hypothetical protein
MTGFPSRVYLRSCGVPRPFDVIPNAHYRCSPFSFAQPAESQLPYLLSSYPVLGDSEFGLQKIGGFSSDSRHRIDVLSAALMQRFARPQDPCPLAPAKGVVLPLISPIVVRYFPLYCKLNLSF